MFKTKLGRLYPQLGLTEITSNLHVKYYTVLNKYIMHVVTLVLTKLLNFINVVVVQLDNFYIEVLLNFS